MERSIRSHEWTSELNRNTKEDKSHPQITNSYSYFLEGDSPEYARTKPSSSKIGEDKINSETKFLNSIKRILN